MSSIRLHRKYGVNPTIPTCFFCGKPKNEIILAGAAVKEELPMHSGVWDHSPCDECEKLMKMGVMFISVRDGEKPPEKYRGEQGVFNPYRTGRICVIRDEAVRRIFTGDIVDQIINKTRFAFIEDSTWKQLGLPERDVDNMNGA